MVLYANKMASLQRSDDEPWKITNMIVCIRVDESVSHKIPIHSVGCQFGLRCECRFTKPLAFVHLSFKLTLFHRYSQNFQIGYPIVIADATCPI